MTQNKDNETISSYNFKSFFSNCGANPNKMGVQQAYRNKHKQALYVGHASKLMQF